jgi:hypothetical protein
MTLTYFLELILCVSLSTRFRYRLVFVNQEQHPGTLDKRCTCPDPKIALANNASPLWNSHHQNMVHIAEHAPVDLDVVFFGDDMIEQLSGTQGLGVEGAEGMEDYFEKTFTKKGGGKVNAIALGSSGDTVRYCTEMISKNLLTCD